MSTLRPHYILLSLFAISIHHCTESFSISISQCENVTLNRNQMTTTCWTVHIFPQAKCQFALQNGEIDKKEVVDETSYITYTHYVRIRGDKINATSCTLQYPVDGLQPGNWTVQASMFSELDGVLYQGSIGQAANTLELSVPTVNIDPNHCPKSLAGEGDTNVRDGYIRQGEQASCLCSRTHAGNPPGTIGWTSNQGTTFDVLSQSEDAATIQINSPDTFTCQSTSLLDGSHSMTYTPNYAYGPSSVSLTFQPPGPINVCYNQQTNINITCQVPDNMANPAGLFTIRDDSGNNLVTKAAGDRAWSKSVNYNFTESGEYTFTCRVENAIFNDMFSEATPIQVHADNSTQPKEDKRPLTTAEIAGTVVGVLVGTVILVAVIVLIVYFFRREKAKLQNRNRATDYDKIEMPPAHEQHQILS